MFFLLGAHARPSIIHHYTHGLLPHPMNSKVCFFFHLTYIVIDFHVIRIVIQRLHKRSICGELFYCAFCSWSNNSQHRTAGRKYTALKSQLFKKKSACQVNISVNALVVSLFSVHAFIPKKLISKKEREKHICLRNKHGSYHFGRLFLILPIYIANIFSVMDK